MALQSGQKSTDTQSPHNVKWYESLHFRFVRVQILLLVFIVTVTVLVIITVERSLLARQGLELAEQLGRRVVSELKDRLSMAESLVTSMANLGEVLEADAELYHKVVPHILDYEGEEAFIAGGGIWPEPYAFDPDRLRRSFFWGRDAAGKLQYYDDYNFPQGPGYHNEEWYVPARYYPPGQIFWSKSYMDPYSYQPMVTATAPMRRDGEYIGVATVDIKLEGLAQFLEQAAEVVGGYIFALDRNNKLLSFPREDLAKIYTRDTKGNIAEEYIDIHTLARNLPAYRPVAEELDRFNQRINQLAAQRPDYRGELVEAIAEASYQIGEEEARLITSTLTDPLHGGVKTTQTREINRVPVPNDPILNTATMVSLFHVPGTYWKIAVVTPVSRFYSVANEVTWKVASYMVLVEVIALLIMFLILKRLFINPIKDMAWEVKQASRADAMSHVRLDDSRSDELGVLATAFNVRTERLYRAMQEIDEINRELEIRVARRTEELSKSERKFRRLIEGFKDEYLIFSYSPEGKFTYVSPSAASIFGMAPEQLEGKYWREVLNVDPTSLQDAAENEKRMLRDHATVECRLKFYDAQGKARYLDVQSRPVFDEEGELVAIEGIGHDITGRLATEVELKDAHEQLLQSEKMASIGQLAAGVAHEINNPVGFIGSNIQTLEVYLQNIAKVIDKYKEIKEALRRADVPLMEEELRQLDALEEAVHLNVIVTEMWEIISESRTGIERIKKIVSDLRTFSRGDQDQDERIRLDEVIDSVLGIVHNELKYRIELRKEYGDIPPITCNPQRLGQVFVNLILNAVQAIEDHGTITVRTYRQDNDVVAEIIDDGPGIPEENLGRIFDAFYTTKPVGHGTGLGLSISYEIIKKHGGDIQVKSTVGEGTTFTISLPIREEE